MRIVLLTGTGLEHRYVTSRFIEAFGDNLQAVIVEERPPQTLVQRWRGYRRRYGYGEIASRVRAKVYRRLKGLDERRAATYASLLDPPEVDRSVYRWVPSHNGPEGLAALEELQPDVIAVYGTGILREPVWRHARVASINMHTGLSPRYRGSDTIFWPLHNEEPEWVGVTVHRLTRGVDAGPILATGRPSIEAHDDEDSLFAKSVRVGTDLFIEEIRRAIEGTTQETPQDLSEGYEYRFVHRTVRAERRVARLIREGFLRHYAAGSTWIPPVSQSSTLRQLGKVALTRAVLGSVRTLGRIVFALGGARLVIHFRARRPRVLLYHACAPEEGTHISGLRSNTPPERFEAQLDFIAQHYTVTDLRTALSPDRPPAAAAITFDDGYRSVYEYAFPALKARGFPAKIYLISSALGEGAMVWVNAINDLLHRSAAAREEAAAVASVPVSAAENDALPHLISEIPADDVPTLVSRLADAARFDPTAEAEAASLFLTHDQVMEMAEHGITFGNHTVSHPNLARCDEDRAREEVIDAHHALRELDGFTRSFAFPFGLVSEEARNAAIELGYTSVVEVGGVNEPVTPFAVARQPVRSETPAELFAEMEFVEPFKAWVRAHLRH